MNAEATDNKALETALAVPMTPDERAFALIQRKARLFSSSTLVPKEYRQNLGNCVIALNIASRQNLDALEVMNNLDIINGRGRWKGTYIISRINLCGIIKGRLKFRFDGTGDNYGCTAWGVDADTGEEITGTKVDWKLVKGEGWASSSKWKNMPDQMFKYRAATFFERTNCPEIEFGFQTEGEPEDSTNTTSEWDADGVVITEEELAGESSETPEETTPEDGDVFGENESREELPGETTDPPESDPPENNETPADAEENPDDIFGGKF